jgi:hypothetical protein
MITVCDNYRYYIKTSLLIFQLICIILYQLFCLILKIHQTNNFNSCQVNWFSFLKNLPLSPGKSCICVLVLFCLCLILEQNSSNTVVSFRFHFICINYYLKCTFIMAGHKVKVKIFFFIPGRIIYWGPEWIDTCLGPEDR